ncbi:hypothetical protein BN2476_120027 [Paraburkholderia piptadeniae]|uniref:Uncharacterized protein n=1 Tax=Paraburkholderia piptadeniae TaxID=1701573 RepID=A0A1N7RR40_9BURK|nr:hypothetical protein BN2476_120027 [Paraburkholderia piptadeniae]
MPVYNGFAADWAIRYHRMPCAPVEQAAQPARDKSTPHPMPGAHKDQPMEALVQTGGSEDIVDIERCAYRACSAIFDGRASEGELALSNAMHRCHESIAVVFTIPGRANRVFKDVPWYVIVVHGCLCHRY